MNNQMGPGGQTPGPLGGPRPLMGQGPSMGQGPVSGAMPNMMR